MECQLLVNSAHWPSQRMAGFWTSYWYQPTSGVSPVGSSATLSGGVGARSVGRGIGVPVASSVTTGSRVMCGLRAVTTSTRVARVAVSVGVIEGVQVMVGDGVTVRVAVGVLVAVGVSVGSCVGKATGVGSGRGGVRSRNTKKTIPVRAVRTTMKAK